VGNSTGADPIRSQRLFLIAPRPGRIRRL